MRKKSFLIVLSVILLAGIFGCNKDTGLNPEYTYLPKTELLTRENSSGFHREYKTVYKYDEKGNVIKETEYTKGFFGMFNVRERQYDTEYSYNENGDISQALIHTEDFCTSITDGHQIYDNCYNYIYNEKQQLISKENTDCRYKYEYDPAGNCIKETEYYMNGTEEEINFEYIHEYDTENKLIKTKEMSHLFNLVYLSRETNYTYDDSNRLISTKSTCYNEHGESSPGSECTYYYDNMDRLIREETKSYQDNGEISREEVREYKDFVKVEMNQKR